MSLQTAAGRSSDDEKKGPASLAIEGQTSSADIEQLSTPVIYKLYKRRWFGIVTLVRVGYSITGLSLSFTPLQVLFNVVCGINGQFFGPITTLVFLYLL